MTRFEHASRNRINVSLRHVVGWFAAALCVACGSGSPPEPSSAVAREDLKAIGLTPRPRFVTDGIVQTIDRVGNTLYIGGHFTSVGPRTGPFGLVNGPSGALARAFDFAGGNVAAVASDGHGGYFVGGDFRRVSGIALRGLSHVRSDGSLDPAFSIPVNDAIAALALSGNTLYVGGEFTTLGGVARNRIAALDATSGALEAFAPNLQNGEQRARVEAIAVSSSAIYVGGHFRLDGDRTRANLVALDPASGAPLSWAVGLTGSPARVHALALGPSTLYVGGEFDSAQGATRRSAAALDASTGALLPWDPSLSGMFATAPVVRALATDGATVYLGGTFATAAGTARQAFAAVDAASGSVTSLNPLLPEGSELDAIAIRAGTLYIAGRFDTVNGTAARNAAALDASGQLLAFRPNPNAVVRAVVPDGQEVALGGDFGSLNAERRVNLAAMNAETEALLPWVADTNISAEVNTVTHSATTVYVGGQFNTINGTGRNRAAAFNATTGALLPWNPKPNSRVAAISVGGGRVYLGGYFTQVAGVARRTLAAITEDTGALLDWNPAVPLTVLALAYHDGIVYAGGFYSGSGTPSSRLAAIDGTSGALVPTQPQINPGDSTPGLEVAALAVDPGNTAEARPARLLVGGLFQHNANSVTRRNLVALGLDGSFEPAPWAVTFDTAPGSEVAALSVAGNALYIGGSFSAVNGQTRYHVAELDAGTGALAPLTIWLDGPDAALAPQGDRPTFAVSALFSNATELAIGGAFQHVRTYDQRGFARFALP